MHPVRILLARHGETDWNLAKRWQGRTDIPLNDSGRAQALALAERLRPYGPARAFASELCRAAETARIAASALGLPPPELLPGIGERSYGKFEGLTADECAERFPDEWSDWRAMKAPDPPGAEGRIAAGERMVAALSALPARLGGEETVFVVSHGGVIRAFLLVALGMESQVLTNGSAFDVRWDGERFVSAERLPD